MERKPNCGECQFFDTKRVNGKYRGLVVDENHIKVLLGVCRAEPNGLLLGVLREDSSCRRAPNIFKPRIAPNTNGK